MESLYEKDLAAWSEQQTQAICEGRYDEIDWNNVAEEISDLGGHLKR